jgi:hypothetical protein
MFGNPVGTMITRRPFSSVASVALNGSTSVLLGVTVAIEARTAEAVADAGVVAWESERAGRRASAARAVRDGRDEGMVEPGR